MRDLDPVGLAGRLTLADLALRPIGVGWLRPGLLALAVLGLVVPSLARRPGFWLALAALTALRVVSTWPLADNHAYLLAYWCLALAIAWREADPGPALAWSGRVLLGLVFALAVLWKAISPDYLDGRFFRATLVTDHRLASYAVLVGGLDNEDLLERREHLTRHRDGLSAEAPPPLEPARFRAAAWLATWGTIGVEALLALVFLWPTGRGLSRIRDPLLLAFCSVTYLFAPVSGFGWLLIALGVAQTDPESFRTRASYVVVFALVYLYREVPWALIGVG
ncbi:MAG: hypothetical protein FJ108_17390 [Deltaproteobacteria bacterium]|nr:hypothetical protein [Deltaproteobacteria bacterium]